MNDNFTRFDTVPLRDLLRKSDSGTWGDEAKYGEGDPVLRSTNITNNQLYLEEPAWRHLTDSHRKQKRLHDGDIIVTSSSGSPDHIGKCAVFETPESNGKAYFFSNFTLRLRPATEKLDSKWLYYWLTSPRGRHEMFRLNNTTSGLRNLNKGAYLSQHIPLPKLEEQKRIAAILDKADTIRRQRQEAAMQSQSLRRAAFYDLFGDPKDNPHGWESQTLGEVSHRRLRNGVSPSRSGDYVGSVLVLSAITGDRFDPSCVKEGTFASAFTESQLVNENDFLICRGNGNIQLVARAAFPTSVIEHCVFPDTMIAATVDPDLLEKEYLEEVWRTAFVRQQVESGARTTNGTHKVNQGLLEKVSFPIPPIPLQQRYGAICCKCEALHEKFSDDADSDLFNSLVQRAFKGEL